MDSPSDTYTIWLRQLLHTLCQNHTRACDSAVGKDDFTQTDADSHSGGNLVARLRSLRCM